MLWVRKNFIKVLLILLIILVPASMSAIQSSAATKKTQEKDKASAKNKKNRNSAKGQAQKESAQQGPILQENTTDSIALNIYGPSTSHEAIKAVAKAFTETTGIPVVTISGPQAIWQNVAANKGDLIYTLSDDSTQKFFEDRPTRFRLSDVEAIAFMDAILLVRKGNPKNIKGIDTIIRKELPLLVSKRASFITDFHRKTWEKIPVVYAQNTLKANERFLTDINVPVWMVWQDVITNNPDIGERVMIESRYRVTRSFNIIIPRKANEQTQQFLEFLGTPEAQEVFEQYGWYFR